MKKLKEPRATQGAEADTELVFQPMWVLKHKPSSAERFLNARFLETQISAHVGQAVPEGFADHFDEAFETPGARLWFEQLSGAERSLCQQLLERVTQTREILDQIDRYEELLLQGASDDSAAADDHQSWKAEGLLPSQLRNVTVLLQFDNERLSAQARVLADAIESRAAAGTSVAEVNRRRSAAASNDGYVAALSWFLDAPNRNDAHWASMTIRTWFSPGDGGAPPCIMVGPNAPRPDLKVALSAKGGGYLHWKSIRNRFEGALASLSNADPRNAYLVDQYIARFREVDREDARKRVQSKLRMAARRKV